MRLDYFILADAAEASQGGKISMLGASFTRIKPPALPFVLPRVAVVIRLLIDGPDDLDQAHEVVLLWATPDSQLDPVSIQTFKASSQPKESDEEPAVVLLAEMPLFIQHRGAHRLLLYLDEELLGERPVIVDDPG